MGKVGRMWSLLKRFVTWLAEKFAGLATILALGVIAAALWLFLQDKMDYEVHREGLLKAARGERLQLLAAKDAAENRILSLQKEAVAARQRELDATHVLERLEELDGGWSAWFRDRSERESLSLRKSRVDAIRKEAAAKAEQLQKEAVIEGYKRDGILIALEKTERRLATYERARSGLIYYLEAAWQRVQWQVLAIVGLWLLGPPLFRFLSFYVIAPIVSRGGGVQLTPETSVLPAVSQSVGVLDIALWPGEVLRVREEIVRGSDEGLIKRGRWLLDWRMPFASFATGLTDLIEMKHSHAGEGMRVSLGAGEGATSELAVVEVPEGGSIVLRPSYLLGVVLGASARLTIRRRWVLFRWIAWITGQLRYYEFVGPCRLILSGARGVRPEILEPREGGGAPARRTQSELLVGFSPSLRFAPSRTESFLAYLRGRRSLFDCVFSGSGVYLVEGRKSLEPGAARAKWTARLWDAVLRLAGM